MHPPVLCCVSLLEQVVETSGLHGCVIGVECWRAEVLGRQLHLPLCRPLQDLFPAACGCNGGFAVAVNVSLVSITSQTLCLDIECLPWHGEGGMLL